MKNVTFPWKNGESPKLVVDFLREKDTLRKNMEIVEDLASEAKFLHFYLFSSFFLKFRVARLTLQTRKLRLVSRPTVQRITFDLPECKEP